MRRRKKLIAWMLAGTFLVALTGCGKGKNTSYVANTEKNAKGRYMETQLSSPNGLTNISNLSCLTDRSIAIVDTQNGILDTTTDYGNTWSSESITAIQNVLNTTNAEITSEAVAPDGGIFFSYMPWGESGDDGAISEKYVYIDKDGNSNEINMNFCKDNNYLQKAVFTKDNRLFAMTTSSEIYEINLENASGQLAFMMDDGALNMQYCGDYIVAVDAKKAYLYDLSSNEVDSSNQVLNDYIAQEWNDANSVIVLCGGTDNTLYIASQSGMYSHVIGGSVMEELAEGSMTNLGDSSRSAAAICQKEDGSFLIFYADGEIDSYVYDPDASAVPEQQLLIYSLKDNDTVRQAINAFRKNNPDVYVKFEIGVSGDDGVTESDAITSLNTSLLAGEGPDIILLDGMPMDSYVEKGMLLDMSDVVAELEESNSYFDEILEAYKGKSGIFAVPFRYYVPALAGNSEILDGISDLNSLADAAEAESKMDNTSETILGTYTAQELLKKLYMVSSKAWYTDDGQVNQEKLTEFLTQASRIYVAEQKNLDEQKISAYKDSLADNSDEENERYLLSLQNQIVDELGDKQVMSAGYLQNMTAFQMMTSVLHTSSTLKFQSYCGQSSGIFVPNGIAGISSNSGNLELAKDFIKTLLGTTVQGRDMSDGFPVNADAFESYSENPYPDTTGCMGYTDASGKNEILDIIWPTDEEIAELKNMIQTLNTPCETDETIEQTVVELGEKAMTGDKSIEECINEIMQKISLYTQE